ncbi:hypothetical protein HG531_003328 [Fusarium graminearum]|nr:hypothetical protein HG531_003328 [Fusarium graminearum]
MYKPVDGSSDHESSSSPGQAKELLADRSGDSNIVTNVIELVNTLLASYCNEDAGDKEDESCQAGDDKVDSVDTAAREEEEGSQVGTVGYVETSTRARGIGLILSIACSHNVDRVPLRDTNGVGQLVGNIPGDIVDLSFDIVLDFVPLALDCAKEAIVVFVVVGRSTAVGVKDIMANHGSVELGWSV